MEQELALIPARFFGVGDAVRDPGDDLVAGVHVDGPVQVVDEVRLVELLVLRRRPIVDFGPGVVPAAVDAEGAEVIVLVVVPIRRLR